MLPPRAFEPKHQAIIVTEHPPFDRLEAEALVEPMRACIAGERIDDDGCHARVVEAALQGKPEHHGAVAAAEIGLLADPDVDCAKALLDPSSGSPPVRRRRSA